jgi:uncharacterized protein YegP (UPF0339 family)
MLLDIVDGSSEYAVQILRGKAGVVLANRLESRNNIIAMFEAPDRQRLAEVLIPVIECIDGITEDLHLLVIRDNELPPDHSAPRNSRHTSHKPDAKFEINKDVTGEFRFKLVATNGECIAVLDGYTTKDNALNGIESIRQNAAAQLEDRTG